MKKKIPVKIVYENEHFIVINKPAGLIVNRSQTCKNQYTLQDWILEYLNNNALSAKDRFGLVHRLDKETSGLMLAAKTKASYLHLISQFKQRLVIKKYLALVHGRVDPKLGTINLPLKRNPKNRKKFTVYIGGKMAKTIYQLVSYYQDPKQKNRSKKKFSLLEVKLITGRTHQIRVHFSHLYHALVSDDLYAGKKTSRSDRVWCPTLFLQSVYLSFHDHLGKNYVFNAKLNARLEEALNGKLLKVESWD